MEWPKARFKISEIGSKAAIFGPATPQPGGLRPHHIDPGQTAQAGAGIAGAADDRIGQDRRQQRRLARRKTRGRTAESIGGAGLRSELSGWSELSDVQVDFQDPLL